MAFCSCGKKSKPSTPIATVSAEIKVGTSNVEDDVWIAGEGRVLAAAEAAISRERLLSDCAEQCILHMTAKAGMTIFLLAVFENRLELVQLILQSTVSKHKILRQCDGYGNTALHLAVLSGSSGIISILVNEGLQKDRKNKVTHAFSYSLAKLRWN